ncbi:MAG: hypothetical protein HY038_13725 [Nitrospirae bacterium]|nr:hypothetical protein [Nitrospirota bacterium]
MADRSLRVLGIIALLGTFVSGCAIDEMMGSSAPGTSSGSGATFGTEKNIDRVASGAVEDTLNACLARIPTNASAGQKLLAEESCRRDQSNR